MFSALTFSQEIWKTIVASIVPVVITVAVGGWLLERWKRSADTRVRSVEESRQLAELRRELLARATRVAGSMFIACQDASRKLHPDRPPDEEHEDGDALKSAAAGDASAVAPAERARILDRLDKVYLRFAVEHRVMESELASRYGYSQLPLEGEQPPAPSGCVQCRWHQIADLLTVYYFNLKSDYRKTSKGGSVLRSNTLGHNGKFHSGLELEPLETKPNTMRNRIRKSFEQAIEDLTLSMLSAPVHAEASEPE